MAITSALSTAGQKFLRHFAGIICFTSVHCRSIYTCVVNQKTHMVKYTLKCIINHLHVSVTFATIIRVLYQNTDNIIRHELSLDRPVSASSNSLFKGHPSRLRQFGLQFSIISGILLLFTGLPSPRNLSITFTPHCTDNGTANLKKNNGNTTNNIRINCQIA